MSTTIVDVQKELNTYLSHNPDLVSTAINRAESTLDKHTKPITKVKGKYPQGTTLLSNVVQGFDSVWNELGNLQINNKILKNYHQKVNFGFVPADILSSYWAHLYAEDLDIADMPISKYVLEKELLPKVIDDLADLEVNGVYDAGDLGTFGKSMNGINKVLTDLLALTTPVAVTDPSCFKIPLNTLTSSNRVEELRSFELQIPSKIKGKIKKVFMSESAAELYSIDYSETYGDNKFFNDTLKTPLGKREIVAIPGWDSDLIFATTDENFVRLIDVFDGKPEITDIQKQDYKLKVFMEFWKGYDFWIDEMVLVSNFSNSIYGLGLLAKNQQLYNIDGVNV